MSAAIVIVNWNGWRDTLECLESVFRSAYPSYRVIVCDNGSRDGSLEQIKSWADGRVTCATDPASPVHQHSSPPVRKPIPYVELDRNAIENGAADTLGPTPLVLIRVGENLGFAGGNNLALQYLLSLPDIAYIWLLNNDTVVAANSLSAMVQLAEQNPGVGMVGSRLLDYSQPHLVQALGGGRVISWQGMTRLYGRGEEDGTRWNQVLELEYITGSSMLVRTEVVRSIGLMDERYFLYSEEVDWCLRARASGWQLVYCPESRVWHKEGASFDRRSPLQHYCAVRSSLLLTEKFYPALLPIAFVHSLYRCVLPKVARLRFAELRAVLQAYRDFLLRTPPRLHDLQRRTNDPHDVEDQEHLAGCSASPGSFAGH